MPRISFSLELIQLIDGIKEPNESITNFIKRSIDKMLRENYHIHRNVKSNGRNDRNKKY